MPPSKELTMRDLARIAGVHQSTVSRALRHQSCVTSTTQQRILRLAEKSGYVQNPLISACMTFRRRLHTAKDAHTTLAYVVMVNHYHPDKISWRENISVQYYEGALSQAERRGYQLEPFVIEAGLAAKRPSEILLARNIHGVIVAPLAWEESHLDLDWKHFCAVTIGFSLKEPPLYRVSHDYYQGMLLALEECRKRGRRRIGFAIDEVENERIQGYWISAYLFAQQSYPPSERLVPFMKERGPFDFRAFQRWVAAEKPDSIISIPLFKPCEDWHKAIARLSPPVDGIGLDVHDLDESRPGIHQDRKKIGAASVDLLISLLERNQTGPLERAETLSIAGCWTEGRSQGRDKGTIGITQRIEPR